MPPLVEVATKTVLIRVGVKASLSMFAVTLGLVPAFFVLAKISEKLLFIIGVVILAL